MHKPLGEQPRDFPTAPILLTIDLSNSQLLAKLKSAHIGYLKEMDRSKKRAAKAGGDETAFGLFFPDCHAKLLEGLINTGKIDIPALQRELEGLYSIAFSKEFFDRAVRDVEGLLAK